MTIIYFFFIPKKIELLPNFYKVEHEVILHPESVVLESSVKPSLDKPGSSPGLVDSRTRLLTRLVGTHFKSKRQA